MIDSPDGLRGDGQKYRSTVAAECYKAFNRAQRSAVHDMT